MTLEPTAPVARLLICVGVCCDAKGKGRALLMAVEEALRDAFPSDDATSQVTCEPRSCLRLCTREPVVRIEPSGDVIANPSVEELLGLVRSLMLD